MHSYGIYTLANDAVYDQLVALLNSIEVNVGQAVPVCVIPFNEQCDRVIQEIKSRPNVTLFDNFNAIQRWEEFVQTAWAAHPIAQHKPLARSPWGKGHHRKFVAYDGHFDRFVFYDADSLVMQPIDRALEKLDTYDFIFDDWEHKKAREHAALDIALIEQTGQYQEAEVRPKLHCSSFFASKRGLFEANELAQLQHYLIQHNEIQWIPRWWDDAFLFTYLSLRSERPLFNFTLSPEGRDRTGNCANADPFIEIDHVLYNQEGSKPIHRIHYMGYPSQDFAHLAAGEHVDIRYKEIFLYYRFLKQPELMPQQLKPASFLAKTKRRVNKAIARVKKPTS